MKIVLAFALAAAFATAAAAKAPQTFNAEVSTSQGKFVIEVHRDWSPNGADRFHDLIKAGYYDNSRFFRAVAGKWIQFGVAGDPKVAQAWRNRTIPDDAKIVVPNLPRYIAFSNTGPNTRSTQIYINLRDNTEHNGTQPAFAPFGKIVSGWDVVEKLYTGYGEASGGGMRAGKQDAMFQGGNAWLDANFPKLDKLVSVRIVKP